MENTYIFDTETTDKTEGEAIEIAYINMNSGEEFAQRYKPSKPISFGAMATHNITSADLIDCPPAGSFTIPEDCEYMVGHNIPFDYAVLGSPEGVKLIDTLLLANIVWPDSDSHTQMACLYRIDPVMAQSLAHGAHGALADVQMNKILLHHICEFLNTDTPAALHEISDRAKIPALMPFGQHKGLPFDQVPPSYKVWYMKQSDTNPDVIAAMKGARPIDKEEIDAIAAKHARRHSPSI